MSTKAASESAERPTNWNWCHSNDDETGVFLESRTARGQPVLFVVLYFASTSRLSLMGLERRAGSWPIVAETQAAASSSDSGYRGYETRHKAGKKVQK